MPKLLTHQLVEELARVAKPFETWLGEVTAQNLLDYVRYELGHEEILDDFQKHGSHYSKALAPKTILHIVSGNTPHAALQSILRGLLLQSDNLCKLPTDGLEEVTAFQAQLPLHLASKLQLSESLPQTWLQHADAVIVFGNDQTIQHFRAEVFAQQQTGQRRVPKFIAHGHKISIGIVMDSSGAFEPLANAAAKDVFLFNQSGCLSPHVFYVDVSDQPEHAYQFADQLALSMERGNASYPKDKLSIAQATQVQGLRQDYQFRAANSPENAALWCSKNSLDWTVIYDVTPGQFPQVIGSRTVFVKPLPADWKAELKSIQPYLGSVGIWPANLENARRITQLDLGPIQICAIGEMQSPPLTWHQDGASSLAALIDWVDFYGQKDSPKRL